ncbi:MAG: GNAT family N-acetyltransferase [Armatimonadota bacterium]|nr:GNAT family N-acetyltransferase [bacterium]
MAKVVLREINKEIWPRCMELTLKLEQGGLVAPNFYRVHEFKAEPQFIQVAIFDGEEMVGYAMYGVDPDDGKYWIYRLMIDIDHQRMGYGKAALEEIIKVLSDQPGCDEIFVGYRPENFVAHAMYLSAGFKRTGSMLQGEYIARLDVKELKAQVETEEARLAAS